MLFNSYVFVLVFLPLTLLGWWLVPGRLPRLLWLTLASYVFYGCWDYRFVPLMVLASSADLVAGYRVARATTPRRRTLWLAGLLAFNLGLLGVFKYYDFAARNLNALLSFVGRGESLPLLGVVLPVGISFYTFNSISYTIDVYRRQIAPTRSVAGFSTFVAMFPHLVAGPIVRWADMDAQFADLARRPRSPDVVAGLWLFSIGMIKKVLVADPIAAAFVTPFFGEPGQLKLAFSWLATLSYTMQIYYDFSGYSDMAVGLALLLGLRFPQNFDSPYKSADISEFWRRWHMSLSFWLRDYLFIPLGGSRGGAWATLRNLAITMFLGGLWHGAAWTFVFWGLYHGVLLGAHALWRRAGVALWRPLGVAATFASVMAGWVLFRSTSLAAAGALLRGMLGARGFESGDKLAPLLVDPRFPLLLGATVAVFVLPNSWRWRPPARPWAAVALAAGLYLCVLQFAQPSPFLYFQF